MSENQEVRKRRVSKLKVMGLKFSPELHQTTDRTNRNSQQILIKTSDQLKNPNSPGTRNNKNSALVD